MTEAAATTATEGAVTSDETTTTTSGTPAGDATGQNSGTQDDRKFTQADLDAIVKDRLERERKQAERQTAKAREEAEAKALAQNAEWQALAEKRAEQLTAAEAKLAEVEQIQQRADRYEAVLKTHLEAQRKDLPAHVLTLLDRLDVADQLDWIASNREALGKTQQVGITATPAATNGKAVSDAERAKQKQRFQELVNRW